MSLFFDPSLSESVYRGEYRPLVGVPVSDAYRSVMQLSFEVPAW